MAPQKDGPKLIHGDTVVVAARNQVYTDLENEVVILNLTDGVYYGLNPVGARIWQLLQERHTVNEIRALLLEEYEVEPRQLDHDLLPLLQELMNKGLIESEG